MRIESETTQTETTPDVQPTTELTAEEVKESRKWSEIEIGFLNFWMNRRLMKRWKEFQDTLRSKENS
jgi:hypothetical protein